MRSSNAAQALVPAGSILHSRAVALRTVLGAANYTHSLVVVLVGAISTRHFTNLHLKWGKREVLDY